MFLKSNLSCLISGNRPFGVSVLYMGWDKHYGYQLYQSDPSGNYSGWKATCIGNNSAAAVSSLKQEYKEGEMTLKDAEALAVKVLSKTLDMTKLTSEKGVFKSINTSINHLLINYYYFSVEMATLSRVNDKTIIHILTNKEVEDLIAEFEKSEAAAEAAKKEQKKS